jgi:hypothetical protein
MPRSKERIPIEVTPVPTSGENLKPNSSFQPEVEIVDMPI